MPRWGGSSAQVEGNCHHESEMDGGCRWWCPSTQRISGRDNPALADKDFCGCRPWGGGVGVKEPLRLLTHKACGVLSVPAPSQRVRVAEEPRDEMTFCIFADFFLFQVLSRFFFFFYVMKVEQRISLPRSVSFLQRWSHLFFFFLVIGQILMYKYADWRVRNSWPISWPRPKIHRSGSSKSKSQPHSYFNMNIRYPIYCSCNVTGNLVFTNGGKIMMNKKNELNYQKDWEVKGAMYRVIEWLKQFPFFKWRNKLNEYSHR